MGHPPALLPIPQPHPQVDFAQKNEEFIPNNHLGSCRPPLPCPYLLSLGSCPPRDTVGSRLALGDGSGCQHRVTRAQGEGGERAKPFTHLEAIIPLLAQVAHAALLALGESQGELWCQRGR